MTGRAAIERRLSELEAKTKPKRIDTLADWVLFIANRRPGEPWPPVNPVIEEAMSNLQKNCEAKNQNPDQQEV